MCVECLDVKNYLGELEKREKKLIEKNFSCFSKEQVKFIYEILQHASQNFAISPPLSVCQSKIVSLKT